MQPIEDSPGADAAIRRTRALAISRPELAALVGIVGIAGFLRFFHLGPGLSDDEVYSLDVANRSLGGILRTLERADTHPPLSYFLLHFWMRAFGSSEVAVRSLAALFGVCTVLMLFLLGRLLWGPATGLLAAFMLSLSDINVLYSHDDRMYSLMSFLVAASFYFFARLGIAATRTVVALYLLASAALIYTHVWGIFFVAAQSVVVAVVLLTGERVDRAGATLRWLLLQAALLVLWSPWLVLGFRRQIKTTLNDEGTSFGNLSSFHRPTIHDILHAAYLAANTHALALLFVAVVSAALATRVAAIARGEPRSAYSKAARVSHAVRSAARTEMRDPRLVLLSAWLVVPLLIAVVLSYLVTPIFQDRYAIALSLPVYLAVAVALTRLPSKAMTACGISAIVAVAGLSVERYVASLSDFYRAPAEYVGKHAAPGDLVLYDMGAVVFDHYAHRSDLEGTHIRPHLDTLAFIKLLSGHKDAIDPRLRNPSAPPTVASDLHVLSVAAHYKRVWLLMGPQFPGQLREATATSRLRAAFGPPRLKTKVDKFDVFLFERQRKVS
jgi:mannosyltransferase